MKKLVSFFESLNTTFWDRIYTNVSLPAESFPVLRIFTGSFLLLFSFINYTWISDFPDWMYMPPIFSLGFFFSGFPSKAFFVILCSLILICNLCLILGIKSRLAGLGYVLFSIIGNTFAFSFNKIDHITFFLIPLFLFSFSNWGTSLALMPDRHNENRDDNGFLVITAFFLTLGFFSAGFPKLLFWFNFDISKNGTSSWFYPGYFRNENPYLLADFVFNYFPFWAFKLLDYTALLFELSPIFFLFRSRKYWKVWLITACTFHLMNILIFNIGKFIGLAVLYLAFFDFSLFFPLIKRLILRKAFVLSAIVFLVIVSLIRVIQFSQGIPSKIIFAPDYDHKAFFYAEACVWVFVILLAVFLTLKKQEHIEI